MMNSDVAIAKKELLKTIDQWNANEANQNADLESESYDPEPFAVSIG